MTKFNLSDTLIITRVILDHSVTLPNSGGTTMQVVVLHISNGLLIIGSGIAPNKALVPPRIIISFLNILIPKII